MPLAGRLFCPLAFSLALFLGVGTTADRGRKAAGRCLNILHRDCAHIRAAVIITTLPLLETTADRGLKTAGRAILNNTHHRGATADRGRKAGGRSWNILHLDGARSRAAVIIIYIII